MATASSRVSPNNASIASASLFSTAAPPIMSTTLPFSPAASMAAASWGILFLAGEVFIETAMMSALFALACVAKSAAGAFFPRSMHLNPAFLSDFRTISLGVRCISGSSVPITTVPMGFSGSGGSFSIMDFNQDIKITSFLLRN